jgi:hypothetical protein
MKITREEFFSAASERGIPPDAAKNLWRELEIRHRSQFSVSLTAYYVGAAIVMVAMGWFLTEAWARMDGLALSMVGLVYMILFAISGGWLWNRRDLKIAGGLLVTLCASTTPLLVFGMVRYAGWWPDELVAR